jgi:hypothetical protein
MMPIDEGVRSTRLNRQLRCASNVLFFNSLKYVLKILCGLKARVGCCIAGDTTKPFTCPLVTTKIILIPGMH